MTAIGRLSTVALLALGTLALSPAGASAQPTPPTGGPTGGPTAAPTAAPTTTPAPTTRSPAPGPTTSPTTTSPASPTPPAGGPTTAPPAPSPGPTATPGPVAQAGGVGGTPIPPPPPPTPEQLEKAKAAFVAGKKAFDAKDYDVAVEKFKESYRLSRNPLLLYNIGFTFDQMGQRDTAVFYYQKFLSDAPPDAAQRGEVTARAKVLEAELAAAGATATTGPGETTAGPRPARNFDIAEFDHQVIEEAPPGKPLDLTAYVPEDSGWVVTLYYRAGGDAKFTSVAMRPRYNELVGRIPATKMQGVSVQYYLEVRTVDGKVLNRIGKPGSPNIVYLEPKARPRYYPDLDDGSGEFVAGPLGPSGPRQSGGGLPEGGYFDVGTRQFRRGKWIATGTSVALLGTSLAFHIMAASNASELEGEAARANDEHCGANPRPCETFGDFERSLQDVGQRNQMVSRVTLGVGIGVGVLAAYYWYKDVKAARQAERTGSAPAPAPTGLSSLIVAPAASEDYIGGAAALRF